MVQAGSPPATVPVGVPKPGDIVAKKYQIDRIIGVGGMGVVAAATHVHLDRCVAIKFLLPEAAAQPEAVARFMREAQAASSIRSEHVARVIEVAELESGAPYMVMELLEGRDLAELLKVYGRRPAREAVDYVLQACDAIAQAHLLGIVHRDLKPSNLFLSRPAGGLATIKVLDFGISKVVNQAQVQANLTATSFSFGTPVYMSPEQVRSAKNVDPRTDVWALGVILYELLVGAPPFEAESLPALCAMITVDPPAPMRARLPELAPELEAIVLRCLEKDVTRRFQTVGALASALAPYAPPEALALLPRIQLASVAASPAALPSLSSAVSIETAAVSTTAPVVISRRALASGIVGGIALAAILAVAAVRVLGPSGSASPSEVASDGTPQAVVELLPSEPVEPASPNGEPVAPPADSAPASSAESATAPPVATTVTTTPRRAPSTRVGGRKQKADALSERR